MQKAIPVKRKLLIILTSQFGCHTDTYMYCKYLDKTKYDVHYIGFDQGQLRREIEDVKVYYIPVHSNKILRYWIYLKTINRLIRKENFDILFLVDCQGSLLLRLCNICRKSILDIRTGDTRLTKDKFSFFNFQILINSFLFKRISIISESLEQLLHLKHRKCHIIPLGANKLDFKKKSFEELNLFYIGTLDGRNLIDTIEGLSIFLENKLFNTPIQYNIVGFGSLEVEKQLIHTIGILELTEIVIFHGRKNHDEAMELFEKSNLGVIYVPIVDGYTCQPVTKLYECLLAGMPVIATNTLENILALVPQAGVLIDDNPVAFAQGLDEFWQRRATFDSEKIQNEYEHSTWMNIVKNNLEPYLDKVMSEN